MRDKTVRCDNCGAEAWVSVNTVVYGQLDFCHHHYNKHSLMLHAQGWIITNDEREALQVNYVHPVEAPING
jgi:hypothetical protein